MLRWVLTTVVVLCAWSTAAAQPPKVRDAYLFGYPVTETIRTLAALEARRLDDGNDWFQPSNLEVTDIAVGNPATNIIPAEARARVNIRFNDAHTGDSLTAMLRERAAAVETETGVRIGVAVTVSGESFVTEPGPFVDLVASVVTEHTGRVPVLSTSGGTSDARFVKDHCPVVEFGLVGAYMHQVDERVPVEQVHQLKAIYHSILQRYFA